MTVERVVAADWPVVEPASNRTVDQAAAIMSQARLVVDRINVAGPEVRIRDGNKYDYLLDNLDRIIQFQTFSLAEYTYLVGSDRPGIRLWLTEDDFNRSVEVIYFEDVVQWRVDAQGRKYGYRLLELKLDRGGIKVASPEDRLNPLPAGIAWPEALGLTLLVPLAGKKTGPGK